MKTTAAACALVIAGLCAWYAWSGRTARVDPARTRAAEAAPIDVRGNALADEIARLRRGQVPASAPHPGRDVFRFAAAAPRRSAAPPPVVPAQPPLPQAPPPPPLRLIGVAEDTAAGSAVRMAIISAPDQLYVVREGERVTSRYGVMRISADVVELVDTGDSTPLRLALK